MAHDYDNVPDNQKLIIWIDDQNKLRAHGPIGDKILCYGMLEAAKDMVRVFSQQQQANIVQPTNGEIDKLSKT